MSFGAILVYTFALYVLAGACIAAAFVMFGVTRVLGAPTTMTLGARVLIFPGAVALWPYVLIRWLNSRHMR
jgi:hypothetical protein